MTSRPPITGANYREQTMKHRRLATVVSLARPLARTDIYLAAAYLRDQGLSLALARHILFRRGA